MDFIRQEAHRILFVLLPHRLPRGDCKVFRFVGRECFEIIWSYDFGGRSKRRWPAKHDTILWYAKNPDHYTFNYDAIDRIPYMAPGLVTKEKAARGKTPTDVCGRRSSPQTAANARAIRPRSRSRFSSGSSVHSNPGDLVLDLRRFRTTGEAAARGRTFLLIESRRAAHEQTASSEPTYVNFEPSTHPDQAQLVL